MIELYDKNDKRAQDEQWIIFEYSLGCNVKKK